MIYPSDVEQRLGFTQLREKLSAYCVTSLGLRGVEEIHFSSDFDEFSSWLRKASEFKQILEKGDAFPGEYFFDPTEHFRTAALEGAFLEAEDLFKIARSLNTILDCKGFLEKFKDAYPNLFALTPTITFDRQIPASLLAKIDDNGTVKDHASSDLARIRRQLREEQSRVRRVTEQLFRNAIQQGWVPEGVSPTVRDGRVVIPVLAEHKRRLHGFIVDESSTGQTVFIEPADVLEVNNEIRDLIHAERREIVRVLKELTTGLRIQLPALTIGYQFLGELELVRAKAKLAIDQDALLPTLKKEPDLNWLSARHPLLYLSLKGKRALVPLTVDLTIEDRMLLVSGPNAGGKSVCLKTVGLIQYMAQCGLLVPVHDRSTVGTFENLFLDIGDQQSIENDLSTYSSHLRNMGYFISHANERSLVLLDELGSGTDPNFGGGIAQAVLEALLTRKAWGVATTHYYNLKVFAENTQGIRNGAMLFDNNKLEPLFMLEIGRPGSSFALEIARKTGLPKTTLEAAESIIGKELTGLDSLIKTVADEKQLLAKKEIEFREKEKALASELSKYKKLSAEIESRKKEIINSARSEASHILKETNREIEKTIRHIRENKAEKKETRKVRLGLKELGEKVAPAEPVPAPVDLRSFDPGDYVRIIGQEVSGTVISIDGKKVTVQFGDLRTTVKIEDLVRSDLALPVSRSTARSLGVDLNRRQSQFVSTLDVRGKRVEEVLPILDQFMDDAILLGQSELRILHGKGEGVLRNVIREHLKTIKQVASVRDEHVDRGGAGITVVVLK